MIKKLYKIHSWTGFNLGFFLLILTITGIPALFKQEIDESLNSSIFCIQTNQDGRKPFQELIDIGRAYIDEKHSDFTISRYCLPEKKQSPFIIEFRRGDSHTFNWHNIAKVEYRQLFINPYTGKILSNRDYYKTTAFFIRNIHVRFFDNYCGRFFIGVLGIIFTVNIVCGIIIYPKFLYRGKIVKVRRFNLKLMWSDLHKLGGFIAFAFLLMICVTGAWLGVQANCMDGFSIKKPNSFKINKTISKNVDKEKQIHYEKALNSIKENFPSFIPYYVYISTQGENTITFLGDINNIPFERHTQKIVFNKDQLSKPLFIYDIRTKSWKDQLFYIQEALHFGDFYGVTLQLIYALFSFIIIGIILSGYYVSYKKSKHKQQEQLKKRYKKYTLYTILVLSLLFILNQVIGSPLTSLSFVVFIYGLIIFKSLKKVIEILKHNTVFSS